jgi:DNA-binding winged helix-turn-helix (wHTH) protein
MRISAQVTVLVDGVGHRLPRAPVGLFLGPVPSGGPLAATLSDDDGTCTLAADVGVERADAAGSVVCAAVLVPFGEVVGASAPVRLGRRPARLACCVPAAAASRLPQPVAEALPYSRPRPIVHGPIRVEPDAKRVSVGAQVLELTPTERALLELFAAHPERAFSRMELLRSIWNSHHEGYARNVDCHVARLRRKIAAAGVSPAPIRTVRGTGYAFTVACVPGID